MDGIALVEYTYFGIAKCSIRINVGSRQSINHSIKWNLIFFFYKISVQRKDMIWLILSMDLHLIEPPNMSVIINVISLYLLHIFEESLPVAQFN